MRLTREGQPGLFACGAIDIPTVSEPEVIACDAPVGTARRARSPEHEPEGHAHGEAIGERRARRATRQSEGVGWAERPGP